MPGLVLHVGATVICSHGGQSQPLVPNPRVLVGGQPVVTLASPWAVAGCSVTQAPCVTGQWLTGAVRVLAGGTPLAIQTGASTCAAPGTPMQAIVVQPRVTAS